MPWPYMCSCEKHVGYRKEKNQCNPYAKGFPLFTPTGEAWKENQNSELKSKKMSLEPRTIQHLYPDKVPLMMQRCKRERKLPGMVIKFLAPFDMTIGTLNYIMRKRLKLSSQETIFLLINNQNIYSSSYIISEVYRDEKADDGFLHISYASQEVYG